MRRANIVLAWVCLMAFNVSAQEPLVRNLGDFAGLSVTGSIRAEIWSSEQPYVEVLMKGTSADNVITEIKSGVLSVRLKTNTPKEAEVTVKVYYTHLDNISSQAQALVIGVDTLTGKNMDFEAKTGGKMDLVLKLNTIRVDVGQGSTIVFQGSVEKQEVKVNTAANYSAYQLEARDSYVVANAGGKAKVRASRIIDAQANAKGFIGYKGNPASTYFKTNLGGEIAGFKEGEDEEE
jgi:hypothetical protein